MIQILLIKVESSQIKTENIKFGSDIFFYVFHTALNV